MDYVSEALGLRSDMSEQFWLESLMRLQSDAARAATVGLGLEDPLLRWAHSHDWEVNAEAWLQASAPSPIALPTQLLVCPRVLEPGFSQSKESKRPKQKLQHLL